MLGLAEYVKAFELKTMISFFSTNDSNPSPAPAPRNFTLGRT